MAKVEIELNQRGIAELFKSAEVASWVQDVGNAVAAAAGDEFEANVFDSRYTAICNVYPTSVKAHKSNLKHNTLLNAIGAVGLPTKKPRL